MATENKTAETSIDPQEYLATVAHAGRREDAGVVLEMMERATGWPARMWGSSLVGFGAYSYAWADTSEHRFFRVGFAPRKQNLVIYLMPGVKKYESILADLGPYKNSVSCLYLGRLKNINLGVLEKAVVASVQDMAQTYPD